MVIEDGLKVTLSLIRDFFSPFDFSPVSSETALILPSETHDSRPLFSSVVSHSPSRKVANELTSSIPFGFVKEILRFFDWFV
jgi:hypothetical protein